MKMLKLSAAALVVTCAMGLTAISAFALPDISITLSGSAYPLHLNYESATNGSKLGGAAETMKATGLKVLFLLNALSALGTFHAEFKGVDTKAGEKCSNIGETKGTGIVSAGGSFHIVYTSLASESGGLRMGVLYLPLPVELECGAVEFVVKGSLIGSFNPAGSEGTELTNFSGQMLGGENGKATITKYWNDSAVEEKAQLLTSVSGGAFKESDQLVEETTLFTALSPNMFVITSR